MSTIRNIVAGLCLVLIANTVFAARISWIDISRLDEKCFAQRYGQQNYPHVYGCGKILKAHPILHYGELYLLRFKLDGNYRGSKISCTLSDAKSGKEFITIKKKVQDERDDFTHLVVNVKPVSKSMKVKIAAFLEDTAGHKSRMAQKVVDFWPGEGKPAGPYPGVQVVDTTQGTTPAKKEFVIDDVTVTPGENKSAPINGKVLNLSAGKAYSVCVKYTNTLYPAYNSPKLYFALMPDGAPEMEEAAFLPGDRRPKSLQFQTFPLNAADAVSQSKCFVFNPTETMAGQFLYFKTSLNPGGAAGRSRWIRIKVDR